MPTIDINDTPFNGVSRSFTWAPTRNRLECARCGSSLVGRRKGVRHHGADLVEVWRCRCGQGRHLKLEVGAR